MIKADVYNLENEKVDEVELSDEVFDVPVKTNVLHQVVEGQLANRRSGTAHRKSRAEVKGSGRKLWRQKGTGRARVGDAASPTRRGGGVTFGSSSPRYSVKIPKKVRRAALRMALSDKVREGRLFVVDRFELTEIKTRHFVGVMNNFEVGKALIVTADQAVNLEKSSRNVPGVKVMRCEGLNVYDILKYDNLFMEQSAVERIQEALVSQ